MSHRMLKHGIGGLFGALFLFSTVMAYGAASLPPYKDDYFAYPGIISSADNGDYKVIDYNEMRDINGRDAVPEKRVKDAYVSLKARAYQKDVTFQTAAGPVKAMTAGRREGASFVVIYLHGRGGNRLQGMNDFTFGGNFNRVKNLAALNGGLYITPDFKDFADAGEAQIAGLIEAAKASSPSAPLILSCGSQGGTLCWRIAANEKAGNQLAGLILLGSLWDDGFFKSPAFKNVCRSSSDMAAVIRFLQSTSRKPSIARYASARRVIRSSSGVSKVVITARRSACPTGARC